MSHDSPPTNNSPVTLINVFEVPAGHVETFIAQWRERAALMSTKPGFLDTRLHRALSSESRFQLVNVAHWESAEALRTASADPEFQRRARAAAGDPRVPISANPAEYEVAVEFDGPDPSA
jgi:heme-degrading monooxygenase HmoA